MPNYKLHQHRHSRDVIPGNDRKDVGKGIHRRLRAMDSLPLRYVPAGNDTNRARP
jgi:trehalose-6-phosphate synthase